MPSDSGISGQSSNFIQVSGGPAPIPQSGTAPEGIVFLPKAMKILKKMDVLRLERNNKRAERRAAEQEGVSEDEADKLTDIPPKSTDVTQSSKLLFDDDVAAQNEFHAHDNLIPASIFSLAKNGISTPLSLFLPSSLEHIRSSNVKTVKHGTGEFLQITSGPLFFQGFARHYNQMLSDTDLALWFPAYHNFDSKVRAQFFTTPYIINVQDADYRAALQSAENTYLMSNHSGSGSSGSRGGAAATSKVKVERSKPYDRHGTFWKKQTLCFQSAQSAWDTTLGNAKPLPTSMPFMSAPSAATLTTERRIALVAECSKVVTPYHAAGWLEALRDCDLLERYPNLVHGTSYGSPIGNPPTPSAFIPLNMPSADLNPSFIDD
ncbi:hypothetical protein B0H13DRAFT_2325975 [Mycena leptocephala]|nr:hypothetical protein B0H13DRAFT_2325975 [Mycena leptocephala]